MQCSSTHHKSTCYIGNLTYSVSCKERSAMKDILWTTSASKSVLDQGCRIAGSEAAWPTRIA